ncbi:NAD(P)-binding protein [Thelephora ganbajun]|uniref:NAD(P)-binding protein n=1 Tax=Thelephora ganbajun TaxID=370292 RepID=A0ACB6Z246_THEGA|nr:NAD(P)-binding protein [Thelephora ganbajun]
MSSKLVLLTGVSGYTGAHVLVRLLKEGYRVRGVARSRKADTLRKAYAKYGDRVDIVVVEDLVKGDFTDALKGVSAVIHTASPAPGREELKDILEITREGALNIVRQAVAAGIKHVSFIGTVGALLDFTNPVIKAPLSDKDWNPLTEEFALGIGNATIVYTVAKTQAEQALWKFAEEHPELNLTTISPTNFIGPFAEDFIITPGNAAELSTSVMVYNFLAGPEVTLYTLPIHHVDVRDVAAAIVAGIRVNGNHRLLLTGEWFDWADAINHIAATRPELASRLVKIGPTDQKRPVIDSKKALEVLGITLTPWKKSIDDGLDAVLKLEKDWMEKGVDLTPLKNNEWVPFGQSGAATRVEFAD